MYNKWTEQGAQDCQTCSINHCSNKKVGSMLSFQRDGRFHARRRGVHTERTSNRDGRGRPLAKIDSLWVVCCVAVRLWTHQTAFNPALFQPLLLLLLCLSPSSSFLSFFLPHSSMSQHAEVRHSTAVVHCEISHQLQSCFLFSSCAASRWPFSVKCLDSHENWYKFPPQDEL